MVYYVAAIVLVAFVFDFINGFHDSANSIATIVGTRVLSPLAAVMWAACFNFAAAFHSRHRCRESHLEGMIDGNIVTPERHSRRTDRRDHLESHHLVLWDSVELVARADRRIRRRRCREGGLERDHMGHEVDSDAVVHRHLAAGWIDGGILF